MVVYTDSFTSSYNSPLSHPPYHHIISYLTVLIVIVMYSIGGLSLKNGFLIRPTNSIHKHLVRGIKHVKVTSSLFDTIGIKRYSLLASCLTELKKYNHIIVSLSVCHYSNSSEGQRGGEGGV
jgi:hypothetical protein